MSTSPSWFDQEKFSRLLKKKPGAKGSPPAAAPAPAPAARADESVVPPTVPALQPPPAPLSPATSPLGRASTGPLPPVPRVGSGSLPVLTSRAGTGPLPPPRRSSGPLPAAAGPPATGALPPTSATRTGSMAPPPPALRPSTGPLPPPPAFRPPTSAIPPITRSSGTLPPPPTRTSSFTAPPLRAPSGKLPELPAEESPAPPEQDDAPLTTPSSREFPAPSAANIEKSPVRPSVPLPDFKPLFGYEKSVPPEESTPAPDEKKEDSAGWFEPDVSEPASSEERTSALGFDPANVPVESADLVADEGETDPAGLDRRAKELEEQLALSQEQRDQARAELEILRQKSDGKSPNAQAVEEVEAVGRERDEARMEVIVLRSQLEAAEQTQRDTDAMASQLEELSHVIDERDSVRRDYAGLREQYETLKLDRSRGDSTEATEALEEENRNLRDQLAAAPSGTSESGSDEPTGNADLDALRGELKKAKEDASIAQRGLALSQKALQETREALKEASEGPASSKGNLEDLKKERATLVRQNMLLQGQNEQLTRDLSAAKAKLAAQGSS